MVDKQRRREIHLERRDRKLGDGCLRGPGHLSELGRYFWEQSFCVAVVWDGDQPSALIRRHRCRRRDAGGQPNRDLSVHVAKNK